MTDELCTIGQGAKYLRDKYGIPLDDSTVWRWAKKNGQPKKVARIGSRDLYRLRDFDALVEFLDDRD